MSGARAERLRLLVIVNRLFEWSQGFITRELVELVRQGVELRIGARRVVPRDDLDAETAALRDRVLLLPENPFAPRHLLAHARFAATHPGSYVGAVGGGLRLGHRSPTKALRGIVCLFRAAAVAREVEDLDVDLLHAHFLTAPGETAFFLSRLVGVPYGATGHAMDLYVDTSGNRGKLAGAAYVSTCTHANARHLTAAGLVEPTRLHVIHHGVDLELAAHGPRDDRDGPVAFLAVGRFTAKKGFQHLVEACGILDRKELEFSCRIVGRGELEDDLREHIRDAGIGHRVSLPGYVAPARMPDVYRGADVLVVPSVIAEDGDRDGLPNVCLEAMSHGLAIIGSDVAGVPEGVIDGRNGILIEPGDAGALAGAMERLSDRSALAAMQAEAIAVAAERFDVRPNVARLLALMTRHAV